MLGKSRCWQAKAAFVLGKRNDGPRRRCENAQPELWLGGQSYGVQTMV